MRISDEIREWCKWCDEHSAARDELCKLADRIDREMVELPKDADGVPIHVGDTVWECANGAEMTVKELRMNTDKRWVISTGGGWLYGALEVTHARPDSFERIADDLEAWCDESDVDKDACGVPRDLAERIRKLADKEGER